MKKRPQQKCFPVKFTKFLKVPTLKNVCEGLLLSCGRSQNFSAGGTNDFMNFYYDCMKFYLWFQPLLYILTTQRNVMNFAPNLTNVILIYIPLFPCEDITSKNQKIRSMCKISTIWEIQLRYYATFNSRKARNLFQSH